MVLVVMVVVVVGEGFTCCCSIVFHDWCTHYVDQGQFSVQIGEKQKVVGGPEVEHSNPKQHLFIGANDKI